MPTPGHQLLARCHPNTFEPPLQFPGPTSLLPLSSSVVNLEARGIRGTSFQRLKSAPRLNKQSTTPTKKPRSKGTLRNPDLTTTHPTTHKTAPSALQSPAPPAHDGVRFALVKASGCKDRGGENEKGNGRSQRAGAPSTPSARSREKE